ncbi:hypothetical protein KP509_22G050000 [Ceratopteris richardii]|nr:hypothetical protein KP509_22G050000 [Ceratopteris richardii]
MVLGKSGVGKSATINFIFGDTRSDTDAYSSGTEKVHERTGIVHGIKLRVIDTPGLRCSFTDRRHNQRMLASLKRIIKKHPPDIVLYFDRLDMQSRYNDDLPLLRTITDTFGSAIWSNTILVLTHASSDPLECASGEPMSYEVFVAQRSYILQETLRQTTGDMSLVVPVALVENHIAYQINREGEQILPNDLVWRSQLLLLCFASKILAEANSLFQLQDDIRSERFGLDSRFPALPFLLSSLLQSGAQLKLRDEDNELEDDTSDEDSGSEDLDYDDLPPFRHLKKEELKLLDKRLRKAYAEELEYRERLFIRKQLKEEKIRRKDLKKRSAALPENTLLDDDDGLEENDTSPSEPILMPDFMLPPSFDSDNPIYRYRSLAAMDQSLVKPVLHIHGWDHDSGYDGLHFEKTCNIFKKFPSSISGQIVKEKKKANVQMESEALLKNNERNVTKAGMNVHTIGKDLAYTLHSETTFKNCNKNKTTCGLAVTLLDGTFIEGMKLEDELLIGRHIKLAFNGGALKSRGDFSFGGGVETTFRDRDHPLGSSLLALQLSVMQWQSALAISGNLKSVFKLEKTTATLSGNLNNKRSGQISVRLNSSEQLSITVIGLFPLLWAFITKKLSPSN